MPSATEALSIAMFKNAMRRFAASVAIVTTSARGDRFGMTASAITAVTVEPPTLLVCVNRAAGIHAALHIGARFCVNLLASRHAELSRVFSGAVVADERFRHGDWESNEGGPPFLRDAQCSIFCKVDISLGYGSHTIFLGRAEAINLAGEFRPLIYGNGQVLDVWGQATGAMTDTAAAADAQTSVSAAPIG